MKRAGMKAMAFLAAAAVLLAFPAAIACAEGSHAGSSGGGTALMAPDTSAAPEETSPADGQQIAPPAAEGDGGPGSGPPAAAGSGWISGLMAAGIAAALVVAGLLASSIYRKK